MAKRKYIKRSEYWSQFKDSTPNHNLEDITNQSLAEEFSPELVGESLYEATASRLADPSRRSSSRTNSITQSYTKNRFKNIDDGLLPFDYSRDSVNVRDAIQLCQKAYFNVPAFRSTIDMLSDFADSDLFLEGGSAKARNFINAWFKRIKIHDIKSQYFREYYRSGNVFMYRVDGKIKTSDTGKVLETYGATKSVPIPIKYLIVNPTDIATKGSISFNDFQYFKVLTPYEISRLKDPKTEHEIEMYNSLPEDVQVRIQNNTATTTERLYIKLNSELLHVVFAKKQDYEPLSVPYAFSVLDDINKKLELKKIDQAISRSIENVVLLVTMGAEPDKGGVNHKALAAMQNIFKNQSVGRVLVSDYTTKADFIIPDLRKVIGPEKYEILNRDIQEGLQNVLLGDNKYADGQLKMKIFIQRLEESRSQFVKDFLQPEIRRICKAAGMRSWPEVKFVKTDTLDNSDMTRLATRMMELGVLTPEQGMSVVHNGIFPKAEELVPAQDKFKEQREDGYYMPLVNSINLYQNEEDSVPEAKPEAAPIAPSGGRPVGVSNSNFSKKHIVEATQIVSEFELRAYRDFALKFGLEELDEERRDLVSRACESIIVSRPLVEWDETLSSIVDNLDNLSKLDVAPEVLDMGSKHQLDDMSAAILYHSTKI
tara:strand:- start:339 stop:2300 length:1962 start_codon:yes stop_codon:yes gene_type:complete